MALFNLIFKQGYTVYTVHCTTPDQKGCIIQDVLNGSLKNITYQIKPCQDKKNPENVIAIKCERKSKWWTNTHWAQLIKFRFKCLSLHNNGNILMHICHRRRHCHMCVIINVFWVDYCGNLSFEWNTQVAKLNSQKIAKAKKIVKHSINFQLKRVSKWENRTHIKLHHPNKWH